MRLLYDYQIFSRQVYGGISRYFFELMNYFYDNGTCEFFLSLKYSNNEYIQNASFSPHKSFFPGFSFPGKRTFMDKINQWNSQNLIKKSFFDVFHPTYFNTYFLRSWDQKPFVLTIYDMISELYPSNSKESTNTINNKKILAENASKIIAISHNTKIDILKFYDIDESKIEVIHLANSLNPKNIENNSLPERFVLFVGTRDGCKNFNRFVEAMNGIMQSDNGVYIIFAGGGKFSPLEHEFLKKNNVEKNCLNFQLSDTMLASLYKNAELFVFPSLYEGFGLPTLEAFSCGCPVALSERSSLPEVGGNAACYFNPEDTNSMRDAIEKILYDQSIREKLVNRGYRQLAKFSWEKTAEDTFKVYSSLV